MADILFEASHASIEAQASRNAATVRRVTLWGLAINLALSAAKFALGVIASSQALIADGVHSLSDSVTDVAVVVGVKYWSAPADAEHPYGHGRIETALTLFIGVALAAVGIGLGYHAAATMQEPHDTVPGLAALLTACISIIGKEFLYQWTARVGKRVKSPAMMANAWHHRSDALSSIPVAVAVMGTRIEPSWVFLDNIGAIIVSVLILHASWCIAWPALRQLLDAAADKEEREAIRRLAMDTRGVQTIHALRTRHIGMGLQVDVHVMVEPELTVREGHGIAKAVKHRLLSEGPDVVDVLVHIEPFEDAETAQS